MKIKNNKGFSLIEVLVTVGLVGILVGIAVPSYRGYKQNTVKMAIKADVANGSKVYNAKYATESTYCYTLLDVGLPPIAQRAVNPLYKRQAFYGFQDVDSSCSGVNSGDLSYKSSGAGCSDTTHTDQTACTGAGETWTTSAANAFSGSPATCVLESQAFKLGATTNVADLNVFFTANHEGQILEEATGTDCQ